MNPTRNWITTLPIIGYRLTASRCRLSPFPRGYFHIRNMKTIMVHCFKYCEIFNSIVGSIVVDVMNNFVTFKFSFNKKRHDMTMFENVGIVNPNSNVPVNVNIPSSFPRILLILATARLRAIFSSIFSVIMDVKRLLTDKTMQFQHE